MSIDFAKIVRGNPYDTTEFWDDLDREELMEPYDLREREDWRPPTENLVDDRSHMLGHCGRHTLSTPSDQDDDEERRWR